MALALGAVTEDALQVWFEREATTLAAKRVAVRARLAELPKLDIEIAKRGVAHAANELSIEKAQKALALAAAKCRGELGDLQGLESQRSQVLHSVRTGLAGMADPSAILLWAWLREMRALACGAIRETSSWVTNWRGGSTPTKTWNDAVVAAAIAALDAGLAGVTAVILESADVDPTQRLREIHAEALKALEPLVSDGCIKPAAIPKWAPAG